MSVSNQSLTTLINAWCDKHLSKGCSEVSSERIDELKDHLMCVAESKIEQGATESEAIAFAVEQFGDPQEVREQLMNSQPGFRRWLGKIHCKRAPTKELSSGKSVLISLTIAAAILLAAWLTEDERTYWTLSTGLVAMWVVIVLGAGGTRQAARAEWQWLKQKLGL